MNNKSEKIPLLIYGTRKFTNWILNNTQLTPNEAETATYTVLALGMVALLSIILFI